MPYRSGGADYLRQYPKLWKWMNRCLSCGHIGHKPELPDQIGEGVAAHHLRQYFPELSLDERSLCEQCRTIKRGNLTMNNNDTLEPVPNIRLWIEQGTSIHIRAVDPHGDPLEMAEHEAEAVIRALQELIARLNR